MIPSFIPYGANQIQNDGFHNLKATSVKFIDTSLISNKVRDSNLNSTFKIPFPLQISMYFLKDRRKNGFFIFSDAYEEHTGNNC